MARSLTAARAATSGPSAATPAPARDQGDSWVVAPRTVALGATVLAAALTVFRLGHKSLWLDEGYSIGHARMPWGEFWTILTEREPNGGLHSLILFPMIRFGDAEWWLRLPSAAAATATVPLLYLLMRRLFDDRTAALAAVLVALNAFSLQFAQEARAYALVMCVATASTWLFVAFLQEGRRGQWWAWVAVSALLPYAHLFGWLVLGVQVAAALLRRGDLTRPSRRLIVGFATIGVLAGVVGLLVATGESSGQAEGIPGVSVVRFIGIYARVIGNGGVLLLALVAGVWLSAVVTYGRQLLSVRPFAPTERQWGVLLLSCWLVLPVVGIALVSLVQPLFGARYFVILVPAAAGLTAVGLLTLPRPWVRRAGTTLVVAAMAMAAIGWYLRPPADDVRAASETIAAQVQPDDAVVFLPWFGELPFDAYAVRDARLEDNLVPIWPVATWGTFLPDHTDHPDATDIAMVAEHDRVWLVVRDDRLPDDDRDLAAFERALATDHRLVDDVDLDGVGVLLFERG